MLTIGRGPSPARITALTGAECSMAPRVPLARAAIQPNPWAFLTSSPTHSVLAGNGGKVRGGLGTEGKRRFGNGGEVRVGLGTERGLRGSLGMREG